MISYLSAAIKKLRPDAEFSFTNEDYSTIKWDVLEGDAPTEKEIDVAIKQVKADEQQVEESVQVESSIQEGDGLADDVTPMFRIEDPDGYTNLRESPNGPIIREVYPYEQFHILGELDGHYGVEFLDGTLGFIHSSRVVAVN